MKKTIGLFLLLFTAAGYLLWHNSSGILQPVLERTFSLNEGTSRAYRLHSSSLIEIYTQGGSQQQRVTFDAVLNFRVVAKDSTTAATLIQLSDIRFHTGMDSLDKALAKLYASPFIVDFATNGSIVSRDFKGSFDDFKGLSQMLDMLQCRLENATEYSIEENVTDGTLSARYERDLKHPSTVVKHGIRFHMSPSAGYTKKLLHSNITFQTDQVWLSAVEAGEVSEIYIGSVKNATSHVSLSVTRDDTLIDRSLAVWKFDGDIDALRRRYREKSTTSYFKNMEKKLKKERFEKNGTTIASLLENSDPNDPASLDKLVDFLKLYPQKVTALYDAIRQSNDKKAAALINVLELTGTPEAQHILTRIAASEDFGHMNQIRAVIALGGIEAPTNESVAFLWDTAAQRENASQKDLSNTSLLSLGILGPKSVQQSQIEQKLKDEFIQASDDNEKKRILLLSMQNANAENFEPQIFEALDNDSPNIRDAAIKALHGVDNAKVRERLLKLFTTTEDVKVRRRLVRTLMSIPPDDRLMERARKNLFDDPDNLVRKEIILYLFRYRSLYPENISTLEQFKKVERDPNNQRLLIEKGF